MENRYHDMRERQQAAYNEFARQYIFYAFSDGQFREGMHKLGLDPEKDKNKICHIMGGAYIRQENADALKDLLRRHREDLQAAIKADQTGDGFTFDMFVSELADHEYTYTGDTREAVEACGFSVEEVQGNKILSHALQKAKQYCMDNAPD